MNAEYAEVESERVTPSTFALSCTEKLWDVQGSFFCFSIKSFNQRNDYFLFLCVNISSNL